jgi:hypothetical protein
VTGVLVNVGASLTGETVTSTVAVSVPPLPSETVYVNALGNREPVPEDLHPFDSCGYQGLPVMVGAASVALLSMW